MSISDIRFNGNYGRIDIYDVWAESKGHDQIGDIEKKIVERLCPNLYYWGHQSTSRPGGFRVPADHGLQSISRPGGFRIPADQGLQSISRPGGFRVLADQETSEY